MYTAEIQDVEDILSSIEACLTSFQLSLEKDQGRVFVQNRVPKKYKNTSALGKIVYITIDTIVKWL